MICKHREPEAQDGGVEYWCMGGKHNGKMCEESHDDHHVCEWCKMQIAMDKFTVTRRRHPIS